MNTLLICLIVMLSQMPADTQLEWRGEIVTPSVIIEQIIMEEKKELEAQEAPAAAPVEEKKPVEPKKEDPSFNPMQGVGAVNA